MTQDFLRKRMSGFWRLMTGMRRVLLLTFLVVGGGECFGKTAVEYVDSLLGTSSKGYTIGEHSGLMPFVGVPFGSVQWVPMTDPSEEGRVSFDSEKTTLLGYVGTRQMAIWMGEWGQFSFMPSTGEGVPPCELRDRRLRHADILAGGMLEFEMAEDLGR